MFYLQKILLVVPHFNGEGQQGFEPLVRVWSKGPDVFGPSQPYPRQLISIHNDTKLVHVVSVSCKKQSPNERILWNKYCANFRTNLYDVFVPSSQRITENVACYSCKFFNPPTSPPHPHSPYEPSLSHCDWWSFPHFTEFWNVYKFTSSIRWKPSTTQPLPSPSSPHNCHSNTQTFKECVHTMYSRLHFNAMIWDRGKVRHITSAT